MATNGIYYKDNSVFFHSDTTHLIIELLESKLNDSDPEWFQDLIEHWKKFPDLIDIGCWSGHLDVLAEEAGRAEFFMAKLKSRGIENQKLADLIDKIDRMISL